MHVYPNALTVHENGDIIFTDSRCRNIVVVSMAEILMHTFGSGIRRNMGKLEYPCAVAVVPSNLRAALFQLAGCFVVTNSESNKIVVFEPNNDLKMVFGDVVLKRPRDVVVVPTGVKGACNIVVVETGNQQIAEFDCEVIYQSKWKAAKFIPEVVSMIPYGVPGADNMVLVEAKLTLSHRALSVRDCVMDRNYQYLHSFGCRVRMYTCQTETQDHLCLFRRTWLSTMRAASSSQTPDQIESASLTESSNLNVTWGCPRTLSLVVQL